MISVNDIVNAVNEIKSRLFADVTALLSREKISIYHLIQWKTACSNWLIGFHVTDWRLSKQNV